MNPDLNNALQRLMYQQTTWLARELGSKQPELVGKIAEVLAEAMDKQHICINLERLTAGAYTAELTNGHGNEATPDNETAMSVPLTSSLSRRRARGSKSLSVLHVKDGNELSGELQGGGIEKIRSVLLASGVVCRPGEAKVLPFLLDDDHRFYLYRYFDCEKRLAHRLLALSREILPTPGAAARTMLKSIFAPYEKKRDGRLDWQKIAVARALTSALTIISGKPGTGKTTTVANFLACMLADNPELRIALAAPTGKAALRMQEALRERAKDFKDEIRSRLPAESFTLHRLLGYIPFNQSYRYHADNPLPYEVVVVDEASMIDVSLAARLADAIGAGTRLVILGDMDQLAAVENGVVLADIAADASLSDETQQRLAEIAGVDAAHIAKELPVAQAHTPLHDCVIWLRENFRFPADSGIGRLALAINEGRADEAVKILSEAANGELSWVQEQEATLSIPRLHKMAEGYSAFVDAINAQSSPGAVHDAFGKFRILTALRNGPRGAAGIGEALERSLRKQFNRADDPGGLWYPGRTLIVLQNDYAVNLFNGDVGIVLPDPAANGELMVWFRSKDNQLRCVAPARLPSHGQSLALTVHKAQGSEFEKISIVLPETNTLVLTRELLYTAVTRARKQVEIIAGENRLREATTKPTRREGGLLARLREEK